jgi:adenosylhomocysteine nucleosidase
MKILFVASDRMEFAGMLRRASDVHPTGMALDWTRRAILGGNEALLAANGVGPSRAADAVKAAVGFFEPDAIVSTGFCGALSPLLKIGSIVIANQIIGPMGAYEALKPRIASAGPQSPGLTRGDIRSSAFVAQTAEQKRDLAGQGAIAVEMEAAGVAEQSSRYSIPFYCIRAVTDLAGETMANNFNNALRPDGHFATMKILREAFLDPANRLPELLRLRKRCSLAARALGDFFADNRF